MILYIYVPEYADSKSAKTVLSNRFLDLYYRIHPLERYILHYQGKKYKVKCLKSSMDKVIIKDDEIVIKAVKVTMRYYRSVLYSFFAKIIEEEIQKLMDEIKTDFKEIVIPKIKVKEIKGYLGYNYIDHIIISPIIAKFDPKYIKVLLYHEVCHCIVRGHPKEFWDLLDSKLENGIELNKKMNNIIFNDYL